MIDKLANVSMLDLKKTFIQSIEQARKSTVLVYVHDDSMSHRHVPQIYSELLKIGEVDNLDIFLSSPGGDPDAAYKIVKMCRGHCKKKLSVIVPFMAKSAATLLAIGTDEIVMGEPSELGPIDPQIYDKATEQWGATQSIRDCIDFLQERFENSPNPNKTSFVLMPILDKLNPFMIGKYERAVKMSKQYAELLLKDGMLKKKEKSTVDAVVQKLSESYYSHGFAIDSKEAKTQLHLNVSGCTPDLWQTIWMLFRLYEVEMRSTRETVRFIESRQSLEENIQKQSSTQASDAVDVVSQADQSGVIPNGDSQE